MTIWNLWGPGTGLEDLRLFLGVPRCLISLAAPGSVWSAKPGVSGPRGLERPDAGQHHGGVGVATCGEVVLEDLADFLGISASLVRPAWSQIGGGFPFAQNQGLKS